MHVIFCRSSWYLDTGRQRAPGDRDVRCGRLHEHPDDHAELDRHGEVLNTWPRRVEPAPGSSTLRGLTLLEALGAAGVIGDAERVTRVVIDAPVGGIARLYVERIGDTRLLAITPTLTGVEITRDDPGAELREVRDELSRVRHAIEATANGIRSRIEQPTGLLLWADVIAVHDELREIWPGNPGPAEASS